MTDPDLRVSEALDALADDLDELVDQFQGALDFENDHDGDWGQRNANLSMGDFADNWTTNRNKMVESMKTLSSKARETALAWDDTDTQLKDSMDKEQP
ncbi:MAG: type VII secretion target [Dermatophilaceae bacterium]